MKTKNIYIFLNGRNVEEMGEMCLILLKEIQIQKNTKYKCSWKEGLFSFMQNIIS